MNVVIQALRKYIPHQNTRFVFPSQTAAGLWATKTCTLGITRSVAGNRFLAWDRFKEESVQEGDTFRKPASSTIRKLFAEALVQKNAEAALSRSGSGFQGFPLRALVPIEYSGSGSIFAPFIARILPSLARWERLTGKSHNHVMDQEDHDYALLKKEYAAFLEKHGFFEPS